VTATRVCPKCGSAYVSSVERCIDCDVDLVDPDNLVDSGSLDSGKLDSDNLDSEKGDDGRNHGDSDGQDESDGGDDEPAEGPVTFELHDRSGEDRTLLEQLLAGAGVVRAWEGTTLVVDAADRAQVEELVEHVDGAASSALDPAAERVVYEVGEWTADQLTVLTDALVEARIAYEFDIEGDVAVLADDEERVEELLDSLDFGSPESAVAEGEDVDPDDGIETAEIMSDLFVACDRLQKDATDHEGVLGAVGAADRIEHRPLPFGFVPSVWKDIVGAAVALRAAIDDEVIDDDALEEQARQLRTVLRQYV